MRKISMQDLARAAGVSKNTVSLALRHDPQIPHHTQERIEALAREMGYVKNPTVAHLMAQLRAGARDGHHAALALINANEDRDAFRTHPTIPVYVEGCRRRAAQEGYTLDTFWLHDPALDGAALVKILRARGIQGVLLAGLMNTNRLPERFRAVWEAFPCVVTGVRTRDPALSFACADHHMLVLRAVEAALRLGYRRPGLVLDEVIDRLVEHRFTSGFLIAQRALPTASRLAPFYSVAEARENPALFHAWFEKEKPDVILTLYHSVRRWLEAKGIRVPGNVGLIQLERRPNHPEWAGMDQHNDIVGEAAVEMVIGMIHRAETGAPLFPRATLLGSTWVDGSTVCQR